MNRLVSEEINIYGVPLGTDWLLTVNGQVHPIAGQVGEVGIGADEDKSHGDPMYLLTATLVGKDALPVLQKAGNVVLWKADIMFVRSRVRVGLLPHHLVDFVVLGVHCFGELVEDEGRVIHAPAKSVDHRNVIMVGKQDGIRCR